MTSGGSEVEAGGGAGYRRVEELRGQIGGKVKSEYGFLTSGITSPGVTEIVFGEQWAGQVLPDVFQGIKSTLIRRCQPVAVSEEGEVAHRLQERECGWEPGGGEDPVHGWFGVSL